DFVEAYRHGLVIQCPDGVYRRVYPRIFTYSADYPEKMLLATIRDKGRFPCPRCLVPKSQLDEIGLIRDLRLRLHTLRTYAFDKIARARDFIYCKGRPNAFAVRLGQFGFDLFPMLVVDLMHECELGTWKSVFTHLIRLLYAVSPAGQLVAELDARFRQVPTFGRGVIRRFSSNSSEMKRMAARDYEDMLQWHALAKLRMHTDSSLSLYEGVTNRFCRELRRFRDETAKAFKTVELPKERAARQRRRKGDPPTGPQKLPVKPKGLNLNTYKFHALADYARTISQFGTTDSYTTQ
ncbi:hypothetical protein BV22DRAFT_980594, partial [Leucogyrophana mollusca]